MELSCYKVDVGSLEPAIRRKWQSLFKAAFARRASKSETAHVSEQLLTAYAGDEKLALQDLWWALLNSNEFILNH